MKRLISSIVYFIFFIPVLIVVMEMIIMWSDNKNSAPYLLVAAVIGASLFVLANWVITKVEGRVTLAHHFQQSLLYYISAVVILIFLLLTYAEQHGGLEYAVTVVTFIVCLLAIAVNAAYLWLRQQLFLEPRK